jgi:hypothetical protein
MTSRGMRTPAELSGTYSCARSRAPNATVTLFQINAVVARLWDPTVELAVPRLAGSGTTLDGSGRGMILG